MTPRSPYHGDSVTIISHKKTIISQLSHNHKTLIGVIDDAWETRLVVLRANMICADRHVGSCKVHKCMQSTLSEELSFEVNFLRGWGRGGGGNESDGCIDEEGTVLLYSGRNA